MGVRPSSSPRRLQDVEELLARGEAPGYEPGGPLGGVPGSEVLDHGLRMDVRLGIGRELLHRRRAPQPSGMRAKLLEDLLVGVALADRALERGKLVGIDPRDRVVLALPGHATNGRSRCRNAKYGRVPSAGYAQAMLLDLEVAAARSVGALSRLARRGGGTTLPGKLLSSVDPGRSRPARSPSRARIGARFRDERQDDDHGDDRRDRRRSARLEPLRREPPVGGRLHPPLVLRRRARPLRGRRGGASRGRTARAAARGRARATSSATSSTATASSSTSPPGGERRSPACRRPSSS